MLRAALEYIEDGKLEGARALLGEYLEEQEFHLPVGMDEITMPNPKNQKRNIRVGLDWVVLAFGALDPNHYQDCMHNPKFAATALRTAINMLDEVSPETDSMRTYIIRFRCSGEERSKIKLQASKCDMTMSQYIRSKIFSD